MTMSSAAFANAGQPHGALFDDAPKAYHVTDAAMLRAEQAWRAALAGTSITDIATETARIDDGTIAARGCAFIASHGRGLPQEKDDL